MTQISLVDSNRLSELLQDALDWNKHISSLMVSAQNGSILAYAFRDNTPSVKAMRTRSTTATTAYAVAGQEILVFEAQRTGALTVIASIADQILLAVTGPESQDVDPYEQTVHEAVAEHEIHATLSAGEIDQEDAAVNHLRTDLEAVNQELASIIRNDLSGMNWQWPEDI